MAFPRLSQMELGKTFDSRSINSNIEDNNHELWSLYHIEADNARFSCCIVWTPLPVVSWLVPYIGHVGICREDGKIMDFSGSSLVNVDNFAYGAVARYLQLDRNKGCFPQNSAMHTCKLGYRHSEHGTALFWDDALNCSMHQFQHKSYNFFTCNSYSFVANCLNRLCYNDTLQWNVVKLAFLILWKGEWVDWWSVLRSFLPFVLVLTIGISMAGLSFLLGMAMFSLILIGWYITGTCCARNLIDC